MDEISVKEKTIKMIDDLKAVCSQNGLGGSPSEYKIITQMFLYKFINDKFIYEAKKVDKNVANSDSAEAYLSNLSNDDYEWLKESISSNTAKLLPKQFISYLFNHQNIPKFDELFDSTLEEISTLNLDVFSVKAGASENNDKIRLFDSELSRSVTESSKRASFCAALINKIVEAGSFEEVFDQKYDFFAAVFEYLIKDYNKDFGKYAEYYTPHSIATIIAKIMVPEEVNNVRVYDPAAGSGTLVLALAHAIGENNCSIYTQDISQKSSEFIRLNLILNNLVHSLNNVAHDDTLLSPAHKNSSNTALAKFDYIVSNPPFKTDFSDTRDTLAGENYKERFWAGVPNIPNKDKDKMAIYLMFLQHIIFSLEDNGKAAVVVPTGFLTAQAKIEKGIRTKLIEEHWLRGVISMPSNIFANTGTNVSILFIDKANENDNVVLMDASKLGKKVKEGKNQKTVLNNDEMNRIVEVFNNRAEEEDFSVLASFDEIKEKNYSFSAGQYFEIKIVHIDITAEEFQQKLSEHITTLNALTAEGVELDNQINEQLKKLKFNDTEC